MDKEIWKHINKYEGMYEASNKGNVRSLDRFCVNRKRKGSILKQDTSTGYARVVFQKNNKRQRFQVHRLVGYLFIENPENKPCINHIDCNPLNNNVDNLEWCTYSENGKHAYKNGLQIPIKGKNHVFSKPVVMIDRNTLKELKTFDSAVVAQEKTGIYRTGIRNTCTGRVKSAGGYLWKYKSNKFSIDKDINNHKQYL